MPGGNPVRRRRWAIAALLAALAVALAAAGALYLADASLKARPLKATLPPDAWVIYTGDLMQTTARLPEYHEQHDVIWELGLNGEQWSQQYGRQALFASVARDWTGYTIPGLRFFSASGVASRLFPVEGQSLVRMEHASALRDAATPAVAFSDRVTSLHRAAPLMGQGGTFPADVLLQVETPVTDRGVRAILRLTSVTPPSALGLLELGSAHEGNAPEPELGDFDWTLTAGSPAMLLELWRAATSWAGETLIKADSERALTYWLTLLASQSGSPVAIALNSIQVQYAEFALFGVAPPEVAARIPMAWGEHEGFALQPGPWGNAIVCANTPRGWLLVSDEALMPGALESLLSSGDSGAAATMKRRINDRAYLSGPGGDLVIRATTRWDWRVYAELDESLPKGTYRLRAHTDMRPSTQPSAPLPDFATRSTTPVLESKPKDLAPLHEGRFEVQVDPLTGVIYCGRFGRDNKIAIELPAGAKPIGLERDVWRCEIAPGLVLNQRARALPDGAGTLITWEYESPPQIEAAPLLVSIRVNHIFPWRGYTRAEDALVFDSGQPYMDWSWPLAIGNFPPPPEVSMDSGHASNCILARFENPTAIGFAINPQAPASEWTPSGEVSMPGLALITPPQSLIVSVMKDAVQGSWDEVERIALEALKQADAAWSRAHPPEAVAVLRKYGVEPGVPENSGVSGPKFWASSTLHAVIRAFDQLAGPSAAAPYLHAAIEGGYSDASMLHQEAWRVLTLIENFGMADSIYDAWEERDWAWPARMSIDESAWRLARGRAGGSSALLAPARIDDAGRTDVTGLLIAHHALELAAAFMEAEGETVPPRWRERMAELRVELAAALVGGECCINLPPHLDVAVQSPEFPYAVRRGLAELPACSPPSVIEESPRDAAIRAAAEALLASGAVYQPPA